MAEGFSGYERYITLLKYVDSHVTNILLKVDKVTLYPLCVNQNMWKDNEIEGEFFLCNRDIEPYCCWYILNHTKKISHSEVISENFDWKMDEPLLLYRKNKIMFALKFYNHYVYKQVTTFIANIISTMKKDREPKLKQKLSYANVLNLEKQIQQTCDKDTTVIEVQNNQAQSSTSNIKMNLDESDGTRLSSSLEDAGKQEKNQSKSKVCTDLKEIEALASALSLTDKSEKPVSAIPDMFEDADKQDEAELDEKNFIPLNSHQMQQAIMYLMKNDSDFVTKLHESYLKSCMD